MRIRLFIFLFLAFTSVRSQFLDKKYYLLDGLDSSKISLNDLELLKTELKNYHASTSDTVKLKTLSRIVERCYDEKIWTRYNKMMLNESLIKQKTSKDREKRLYKELEGLALNNIGYYFFNYTTNIDSALYYYELGRQISEEMNSYSAIMVSYSNIANVYQNKGDLSKAIELYNKALSYESKTTDKTGVLSAMNNMSNIYMYLGDTTTSLLYLKRCFLIAKESNDQNMKAHLLHNIGALMSKKNALTGMQSIKTSLSIRRQIGDKKGATHSLLMLSEINLKLNNINAAKAYLEEAKEFVNETNNHNIIALYHRTLGDINLHYDNTDEIIKNYSIAIDHFKKSENVNELVETLSNIIGYCNKRSELKKYKLEFIEQYYIYSKVLNKSAAQRAASQSKYENELKIKEAEQKIKDEKSLSEKVIQRNITIAITSVLILTLLFSFFIFKALRANREKTKVINKQKHLVEEKQKEIIDSINYSKRIQNSFIPSHTEFNSVFPKSFVIYKPKDIVSGDFYWVLDTKDHPSLKQNIKAIAVADCTGHGVPGAMLSMLGVSILNQSILERSVQSPADILNFLNSELKKNLRSKNNEIIRDGMDISCCVIQTDTLVMQFAAANNPCWILREGKIIELKADKQAVTASNDDQSGEFNLKEFQLQKDDMLFLFTDGFADQFGGPRGKKFMYSRLEKLLIANTGMQPEEQKLFLIKEFEEWKGSLDQVDDVCLIGIRI
jgi:serine phosphatase RsbU (regulator of sigma subunit)/predicted negative regulator of RcsB-dependent stress response